MGPGPTGDTNQIDHRIHVRLSPKFALLLLGGGLAGAGLGYLAERFVPYSMGQGKLLIVLGGLCAIVGLVLLMLRRPVLTIDEHGIHYRPHRAFFKWNQIIAARAIRKGDTDTYLILTLSDAALVPKNWVTRLNRSVESRRSYSAYIDEVGDNEVAIPFNIGFTHCPEELVPMIEEQLRIG